MDIKPGNLLLSLTGNVKIGDFGLTCSPNSRAESDEGDSTYLSLEGLAGVRSPSCDIFSLGVTLWECLGGKVECEGESWRNLRNVKQSCVIPIVSEMLGKVEGRPDVEDCIKIGEENMGGNFKEYVVEVEEKDKLREEERARRCRDMRRRRGSKGIDRVCTPTQGVEGWGAF